MKGSDRVSSGAVGLDEILGGGFVCGRLHVVEGRPGTGKTTLASVRPQTAVFQRNVGVLALSARISERLAKRFADASRVGVAVKGGGIV